ncbi:hypothetical protein ES708_28074 [subsurface metagenome]
MVEIIKAASVPLAMIVVGLLVWGAMLNGIDGAVFYDWSGDSRWAWWV